MSKHAYIPSHSSSSPLTYPLQNGPRLLDADRNVVASGKEDIVHFITAENDAVRANQKTVSKLIYMPFRSLSK